MLAALGLPGQGVKAHLAVVCPGSFGRPQPSVSLAVEVVEAGMVRSTSLGTVVAVLVGALVGKLAPMTRELAALSSLAALAV